MLHSDRRCLQNTVRNILDGELLNKYLYLSTMERSELAKKIGTTQDIVRATLTANTTENALRLVSSFHLLSPDPGRPSGDRQSNSSFLSHIPTSPPPSAVSCQVETMFCYDHLCEILVCFSYLLNKNRWQLCFLRIFCIKKKICEIMTQGWLFLMCSRPAIKTRVLLKQEVVDFIKG